MKRRASSPSRSTKKRPRHPRRPSSPELYPVLRILDENEEKTHYKLDWAPDKTSGEIFEPTWELKENVTLDLRVKWEATKMLRQLLAPCKILSESEEGGRFLLNVWVDEDHVNQDLLNGWRLRKSAASADDKGFDSETSMLRVPEGRNSSESNDKPDTGPYKEHNSPPPERNSTPEASRESAASADDKGFDSETSMLRIPEGRNSSESNDKPEASRESAASTRDEGVCLAMSVQRIIEEHSSPPPTTMASPRPPLTRTTARLGTMTTPRPPLTRSTARQRIMASPKLPFTSIARPGTIAGEPVL